MTRTHILKTIDHYFRAISDGDKNFEVRRDDRGFQKGDTLILREVDQNGIYTRNEEIRKITYILTGGQFGIEPGYVVLGLKR
jgi:hypothetical protein